MDRLSIAIDVEIGQIVERDGFIFCDLTESK